MRRPSAETVLLCICTAALLNRGNAALSDDSPNSPIAWVGDTDPLFPWSQSGVKTACAMPDYPGAPAAVVATSDMTYMWEVDKTVWTLGALFLDGNGSLVGQETLDFQGFQLSLECNQPGRLRMQIWNQSAEDPHCEWKDIQFWTDERGHNSAIASTRLDMPGVPSCLAIKDVMETTLVGTDKPGEDTVLMYDSANGAAGPIAAISIRDFMTNSSRFNTSDIDDASAHNSSDATPRPKQDYYYSFPVNSIECDLPALSGLCFVAVNMQKRFESSFMSEPYLLVIQVGVDRMEFVDLLHLTPDDDSTCATVTSLALHTDSHVLYVAVNVQVGQTGACAASNIDAVVIAYDVVTGVAAPLTERQRRTIPAHYSPPSAVMSGVVETNAMTISHSVVDGVALPRLLMSGQLTSSDISGFELATSATNRAFAMAADLDLVAYTAFEAVDTTGSMALFSEIHTMESGDIALAAGLFGKDKTWAGFDMNIFGANLTAMWPLPTPEPSSAPTPVPPPDPTSAPTPLPIIPTPAPTVPGPPEWIANNPDVYKYIQLDVAVGGSAGEFASVISSCAITPTAGSDIAIVAVVDNIYEDYNLGFVRNTSLWAFDATGGIEWEGVPLQDGIEQTSEVICDGEDAYIFANAADSPWMWKIKTDTVVYSPTFQSEHVEFVLPAGAKAWKHVVLSGLDTNYLLAGSLDTDWFVGLFDSEGVLLDMIQGDDRIDGATNLNSYVNDIGCTTTDPICFLAVQTDTPSLDNRRVSVVSLSLNGTSIDTLWTEPVEAESTAFVTSLTSTTKAQDFQLASTRLSVVTMTADNLFLHLIDLDKANQVVAQQKLPIPAKGAGDTQLGFFTKAVPVSTGQDGMVYLLPGYSNQLMGTKQYANPVTSDTDMVMVATDVSGSRFNALQLGCGHERDIGHSISVLQDSQTAVLGGVYEDRPFLAFVNLTSFANNLTAEDASMNVVVDPPALSLREESVNTIVHVTLDRRPFYPQRVNLTAVAISPSYGKGYARHITTKPSSWEVAPDAWDTPMEVRFDVGNSLYLIGQSINVEFSLYELNTSTNTYSQLSGRTTFPVRVFKSLQSEPALLSSTMNSLKIPFQSATDQAGFTGMINCGTVLQPADKLGSGASCSFADPSTLSVVLGSGSDISNDTVLSFQGNVRSAISGPYDPYRPSSADYGFDNDDDIPLSAYYTGSSSMDLHLVQPPRAVINGATQIRDCVSLELDGLSSSGSGGRPLRYAWSTVPAINSSFDSIVWDAPALSIPWDALEASSYTVTLQVWNYLELASAPVTTNVLRVTSNIPQITIAGGTHTLVQTWMPVDAQAVVKRVPCVAEQDDSEAGQIVSVQWSLLSAYNASSLEAIDPTPVLQLPQGKDSRKFNIPAYTLSYGLNYVFEVAADLSANGTIGSATTTLEVAVEQSRLFAIIDGSNRTAQAGQGLELVSSSFDPDSLDAELWHTWSCDRFTDDEAIAQSCDGFSTTSSFQPSVWVDGETLQLGSTYLFTLVVSDLPTSREAKTSVVVVPVETSTIDVSIVVQEGNYAGAEGVLNPASRVVLAANINNQSDYDISGMEVVYAWDVTEFPPEALLSSSMNGSYLVLDGAAMVPLKTYTFSLSATVAEADLSGSASFVTHFNLPPTSGSFVVTPSSGVAMTTTFSLQALYWCDEDLPLQYTFHYLRENSSMVPLSLLSERSVFETVLPLADSASGTTTVVMCVYDNYGASTCVEQVVELAPAPEETSVLCATLYDAAYEAFSADQNGDAAITAMLNLFVHLDSSATQDNDNCGDWTSFVGLVVNASQIQRAETSAFEQESLLSSLLSQVPARSSTGLDMQSQLDLLSYLQQILADHHEFDVQLSSDTNSHTLNSLSTLMASGLLNSSNSNNGDPISSSVVQVVRDVSTLQGAAMVPGEPTFTQSPPSFTYSTFRAAVAVPASNHSVQASVASSSGVQDGVIVSDVTVTAGSAVFQIPYEVMTSLPQTGCQQIGVQFSTVDWVVNPYGAVATPTNNGVVTADSGFAAAHVPSLELIDCNGQAMPVNNTGSSILLNVHVPKLDEAVFVYDNVTVYVSCDDVDSDEVIQVFCGDTSAEVKTIPSTAAGANTTAFAELYCTKDIEGFTVTCPQSGYEPLCQYFDTAKSQWSSDGCELHSYDLNSDTVSCSCNHLTEFTASAHQYLKSSGQTVAASRSADEDIFTKSPAILAFVLTLLALYIIMFAVGSRIDERHERKRLTATLFSAYIQLRAAASGVHTYRGDAASVDDQSTSPGSELNVTDRPPSFWQAWLQALRQEHYILSLVWPIAVALPQPSHRNGQSQGSSAGGSVMSKHYQYTSAAKSVEEERYTFRQKLTMCVVEVMTLLFLGCFLFDRNIMPQHMFEFNNNNQGDFDSKVQRAFWRCVLAVLVSLAVMAPLLRAYRHLSSKSTSYIKYEMIVIFERAQLLQQQFESMTLRELVAFQSKVQAAYLVTLQEYNLVLVGWGQDSVAAPESVVLAKDTEEDTNMEETYRETMHFLEKGNGMTFAARWRAQWSAFLGRVRFACGRRRDMRNESQNPLVQDQASEILRTLLVPLEELLEKVDSEVATRKADQRQVYDEYLQQTLVDLPWYKRPAAKSLFLEAEVRRAKRLNEFVLLDTMSRDELITYYRDKMMRSKLSKKWYDWPRKLLYEAVFVSPTPEREYKSTVISKALVYGLTFLYLLFIGWYILLFAVSQVSTTTAIMISLVFFVAIDMLLVTPFFILLKAVIMPNLVYFMLRKDMTWARWEVVRRIRSDGLLRGYNDKEKATLPQPNSTQSLDSLAIAIEDRAELMKNQEHKRKSVRDALKTYSMDLTDILAGSQMKPRPTSSARQKPAPKDADNVENDML